MLSLQALGIFPYTPAEDEKIKYLIEDFLHAFTKFKVPKILFL